MTVDKKLSEKWQYGINRAAAKISLLSRVKIEKHEYLAGENILSLQHNINGRSQIHLPLLRKAFKKQTTIEEQGEKQVQALQSLNSNDQQIQVYQPKIKSAEDIFPEGLLNNETKDELYKIMKKNRKLLV